MELVKNWLQEQFIFQGKEKEPFIAVNCASLNENIIESELLDMKEELLQAHITGKRRNLNLQIKEVYFLMRLQKSFLDSSKTSKGNTGKDIKGFSPQAWRLLLRYDYPGNVRELENIVQRAVILTRENVITPEFLPFTEKNEENSKIGILRDAVEKAERNAIITALKIAEGKKYKAAEILGISERALRYKLKKYGIELKDYRKTSSSSKE